MATINYTQNDYGNYWSTARSLATLTQGVFRSDIYLPAAVSGVNGLHLLFRTGADGQTLSTVVLPRGATEFRVASVSAEREGTLCGIGAAMPAQPSDGGNEYILALTFTKPLPSPGTSTLRLYNIHPLGSATAIGGTQHAKAGEPGSPNLVVYRNLIWVFYFDPMSPAGGPFTVLCTVFKKAATGSGFEVLYEGKIREGFGSGDHIETKFPAVPVVFDDALYLAYVRASGGRLVMIRNRLPASGPTDKDNALVFSEPNVIVTAPTGEAIDRKRRPVTVDCGPGFCAYGGLLYLTYTNATNVGVEHNTPFEVTYDGHTPGVQKLFDNEHRTHNTLRTVLHAGSMYTFYLDDGSG